MATQPSTAQSAEKLVPGFVLPIDPSRLESDRLRLAPVEADMQRFMKAYVEGTKDHLELFTYLPYGPFQSIPEYEAWYKGRIGASDSEMLFAMLLKEGTVRRRKAGGSPDEFDEFSVRNNEFAGVVGLLNADPIHSAVEVGHITILPRFQRTFVGTQANGLLLRHLLNPLPADLGMRRVYWQANSNNKPSIGAAERLGYKMEGIIRWQRVLPENKPGDMKEGVPAIDKEGNKLGPGRHTAQLSLCWDDWLDGGREKIDKMMNIS